jgi:hypothetical protein
MESIVREGRAELEGPPDRVRHFDAFLAETMPLEFCASPMLFDQRWCAGSDNAAGSTSEAAIRWASCAADQTHAVYMISELRRHVPVLCAVLLAVLIMLLFLAKRGKSDAGAGVRKLPRGPLGAPGR